MLLGLKPDTAKNLVKKIQQQNYFPLSHYSKLGSNMRQFDFLPATELEVNELMLMSPFRIDQHSRFLKEFGITEHSKIKLTLLTKYNYLYKYFVFN